MKLDPNKWYFKTYVYIIAFLCVGPFVLPLAWLNPRYKLTKKVIITLVTIIASYLLGIILTRSMESIYKYYEQIMLMSR